MLEDATAAGKQLQAKLKAKSVEPGKYDLVLDPAHLMLTIHESVGHPLELDRVLGYEANFAGTSFATLDKWRSGKFNYGSERVNLFADKTQPYSLGNVGYDDEGVKTKEWDLVKDGTLVNYQATRDQVHMIDQKESHGCCYSQSWRDVQFQRMPNVSLKPNEKTSRQMMSLKMLKMVFILPVEVHFQSINNDITSNLAVNYSLKLKTVRSQSKLKMLLINQTPKSFGIAVVS